MEQVLIFLSAFLVMFVYTLMFFYYHKGKHKKQLKNPPKEAANESKNWEEGPVLDLPPGVCWLPPDAQDPSMKDNTIKK